MLQASLRSPPPAALGAAEGLHRAETVGPWLAQPASALRASADAGSRLVHHALGRQVVDRRAGGPRSGGDASEGVQGVGGGDVGLPAGVAHHEGEVAPGFREGPDSPGRRRSGRRDLRIVVGVVVRHRGGHAKDVQADAELELGAHGARGAAGGRRGAVAPGHQPVDAEVALVEALGHRRRRAGPGVRGGGLPRLEGLRLPGPAGNGLPHGRGG
mmetsp:Transcript_39658/g.114743  ORF Transcript_39658/g.114743 Transcript_39658/m.114743 type:complete len:214 (+) Transcript_39658:811-1452(+)